VPPSKASPSESSQLSPLVCSDTLTPLVHYAHKLIALVQCQDYANVLHNLKIGCTILRLARTFRILRMHSAILRLRRFLDCTEQILVWVIMYMCMQPYWEYPWMQNCLPHSANFSIRAVTILQLLHTSCISLHTIPWHHVYGMECMPHMILSDHSWQQSCACNRKSRSFSLVCAKWGWPCIYVVHDFVTLRLRCTFSESRNCLPWNIETAQT